MLRNHSTQRPLGLTKFSKRALLEFGNFVKPTDVRSPAGRRASVGVAERAMRRNSAGLRRIVLALQDVWD